MKKEHKTLLEFYSFIAKNKKDSRLQQEDAQETLNQFYEHLNELAKIADKEKAILEKARQKRIKEAEADKEENIKRNKEIIRRLKSEKNIANGLKSMKELTAILDRNRGD